MIAWLTSAVRTRLMVPLTLDSVPAADRCVIDDGDSATMLGNNELVLANATTQPQGAFIGGGGTLRHIVTVDLTVQDGDRAAAVTRRDYLVGRLLLPAMLDPSLGGAEDTGATSMLRQELNRLTWQVSWGDGHGGVAFAAYASVTMTADADWRPATLSP